MAAATALIFGPLSAMIGKETADIGLGPYPLGQHGKPEISNPLGALVSMRALGLTQTENSYVDAVARGINIFYGFTGDTPGQALLEGAANLITAPGYYAVVTRNILRSGNTIANAIADFDFSNPVSGIQSIMGLIEIIKSSKIIAYINILAGMGDIALRLENQGYEVNGEKNFVSSIDDLPSDNPATHVMKSRENGADLTLAWRTSSTPSTFILPSSLAAAALVFNGSAHAYKHITTGLKEQNTVPETRRISPDAVRKVENTLEAEYVPFYFHDLRTNEIVSFHAFLGSLSDEYTSDYESIDAYGRVDPIKIYRKTERKISLSFHVAATNRDDFDVMWWKINKLVTLLYPQWSKGNTILAPDGSSFIQPFSQIPTASPLIRLRVGDVIRSNYSKFNLSRVFGLGQEGMILNVDENPATDIDFVQVVKDIQDTVKRMSLNPDVFDYASGYEIGEIAILQPRSAKYEVKQSPGASLSSDIIKREVILSQKVTIKNKETVDISETTFRIGQKTTYTVTLNDGEDVYCTHADLRTDPDYVMSTILANDLASSKTTDALDKVNNFFSNEPDAGNPVVRAFESTRGRGLAGVIDSISFDWYEPVWETEPGARAPKWCKVEMGFSPIHDIPPGLDSDGFNRAPIYPVGSVLDAMGDVYDDNIDIKEIVKAVIASVEGSLTEGD